jgi:hypothetical protein
VTRTQGRLCMATLSRLSALHHRHVPTAHYPMQEEAVLLQAHVDSLPREFHRIFKKVADGRVSMCSGRMLGSRHLTMQQLCWRSCI